LILNFSNLFLFYYEIN